MSAPISHIVFADKILKRLSKKPVIRDYYIGVCFPDIRYLSDLDKQKTHLVATTIENISDTSSFFTGVRCHVFLDMLREDYFQSSGVNHLLPVSKHAKMALKFYEDRLRLNDFANKRVIDYLDFTIQEENTFGFSKKVVRHWHFLLKQYLMSPIEDTNIKSLLKDFIIDSRAYEEIVQVLADISRKKEIEAVLNQFYYSFDQIVNQHMEAKY